PSSSSWMSLSARSTRRHASSCRRISWQYGRTPARLSSLSPTASTRHSSFQTASSSSILPPGGFAPLSIPPLPASVWKATSARIPISENPAPSCATCSGANHDLIKGYAAPPGGAGAAADIGAAVARCAVQSERDPHGIGRRLLRHLGILRPPPGSDLHVDSDFYLPYRAPT